MSSFVRTISAFASSLVSPLTSSTLPPVPFFSQTQRSPHVFYRHDLINQLQHNHALVTLVAENLSAYMETMRQFSKGTLPIYQVHKWPICSDILFA